MEVITSDKKMLDLIQLAKTVAQSKATVLIQGESGTGKELMASVVHRASNRSMRPFIAINCAAIPDALLESELFGYERGAFTGAVAGKAGKFELANGGTLLLDEIGEMDIRLQAKLLRVLQQGQVDRIGGRAPISVDVRIIATTNKNLADAVKDGVFREDLYFRLNVVNLTIPPLRERIGDVRLIVDYFRKQFEKENGKSAGAFTEEALRLLDGYSWPGNIRELENVVERSLIMSKGTPVKASDIFLENSEKAAQLSESMAATIEKINWTPGQTLGDIEKFVILEALQYHKGNRTHTARSLGISIRTLRNKLSDYRKIGIFV